MTKRLCQIFPNEQQELLLKTCLFDGDAAIGSWRAWQKLVDVEELDIGSQRLLPLAYQNLSSLGVEESELERYRGVARYVWYENQSKLLQVQALLSIFSAAQIPVILLKGMALAPLYYKNWALRPTNDLDILVPTRLAGEAGALLASSGWRSPDLDFLKSAAYRTTIHATAFSDGKGHDLDLHWHAVRELCSEDADSSFWEAAQILRLNGRDALALGDTDQLFHIIIHATHWDIVAPIRWVADTAMLLRVARIDWDRFLKHVVKGCFVLRARLVLRYLRDRFHLPIPDWVQHELDRARSSPVEALEARIDGMDIPLLMWQVGIRYVHYRRNCESPVAPRTFPSYIRTTWGSKSWTGTLKAAAIRLPHYIGFPQR